MAGKKKQAKNQAVSAQGTLGNVTDYRHDEATRKNNPPAKIAAEGGATQQTPAAEPAAAR